MWVIYLMIGFWCGGIVGFVTAALMQASQEADDVEIFSKDTE